MGGAAVAVQDPVVGGRAARHEEHRDGDEQAPHPRHGRRGGRGGLDTPPHRACAARGRVRQGQPGLVPGARGHSLPGRRGI